MINVAGVNQYPYLEPAGIAIHAGDDFDGAYCPDWRNASAESRCMQVAQWPLTQRHLQKRIRQNRGAVDDVLTTSSIALPAGIAFFGGVLLPDGRIFCVPYNSVSARIYDPINDTLITPTGVYPGGGGLWRWSFIA